MSDLQFGMRLTYDGKSANVGIEETRAKVGSLAASTEQASARMTQQMTTAASSMNSTAISAKQLSMATRQLPMQFTDIAVGLASGQSPMMVMLQQGGQLKDVFGGVGNAAKAMGAYVVGMVNPITLAAAAAMAAGYAWYSWGRDAESAADKAIAASDKIIGSMRSTDAVYVLQRERDALAKKVPFAWLGYDDKQLQKLDEDSQNLVAKIKEIDKKILTERKRSGQSWETLTATNSEKKDAELKNLKQLYDEQLVLHRNNKQELLKDEQEYQNGRAQIIKKYAKKSADSSGMQVIISLERDYQNELAKREDALNAPLLSASERALEEDLRMVSKRAQDARVELEKQKASQGISEAAYTARMAEAKAAEVAQADAIRKVRAEQDQLNASWEYGASIAMRKYQDEAANTAAMTEKFFTASFKSMEDQEIAMLRRGKADWRAFGDTIINELLRIQVAKANAQVIGWIAGMVGGGSTTGGADLTATGQTPGGYTGIVDGIINSATGTRANGGPVAANSLYRVNERGPELLHQDGNDYLMMGGSGGYVKPLSSESSTQGGGNVISIQVAVNANTGETQTQSNDSSMARLGSQIAGVTRSVIMDEMRPGGLLARRA